MSQFLSTLKSGARAAVVALSLGAASVLAMPAPAMAQSFSFDFGIGGGGNNFSFSIGKGGKHIRRDCLTNNEVRRGLRRSGWEDIRFVDRRGARVTVIAEWDNTGRDYRITINRCTGRVTDVERLRGRDRNNRPNFGLQFSF